MTRQEDLVIGRLYNLRARNLLVGVWDGNGFVGIRVKFGEEFLFREYPSTAQALSAVAQCPVENLTTGRSEGGEWVHNQALHDWLKPFHERELARDVEEWNRRHVGSE